MRGLKLLAVPLLALAACRKPELPRFGALPDFALASADGGTLSSADLRGSAWIASFLFTSCQGPCPVIALRVKGLQKELGAAVRLVTFTVDPEHDTPKVLAAYAGKVGAGPGWSFLTGKKADVLKVVVEGFKLAAVESPGAPAGERVTHSTRLVLVDKTGTVRGYYDSEDEARMRELARDALALSR